MKIRESGMPDEAYWASFFDADAAVEKLLGPRVEGDVVELGCGYGLFTLPAARRAAGWVTALDIEPGMVARTRSKAAAAQLANVRAEVRDFVADGTGLPARSQAHAMIYNLLHLENPVELLREALRVLRDGGVLSVIHWRSDIPTPRGPPLAIRPSAGQCRAWIAEAGFRDIEAIDLAACCPFHYGWRARR